MTHVTIGEMVDGSEMPETMTLELTDEQIGELKIGQMVEITVKGSVGMLQIPPEGTSENDPALMGIRVESKDIQGRNEFAELAEDDSEG